MLYCKAAYYLEKGHKARTTSHNRAQKTPTTVVIGPIWCEIDSRDRGYVHYILSYMEVSSEKTT